MAHQEDRLHILRVRVICPNDQAFHRSDRRRTPHIVPYDLPSLAFQIKLKLCELRGERGSERIVHDQYHGTPGLHHGYFDTAVHITVPIA